MTAAATRLEADFAFSHAASVRNALQLQLLCVALNLRRAPPPPPRRRNA